MYSQTSSYLSADYAKNASVIFCSNCFSLAAAHHFPLWVCCFGMCTNVSALSFDSQQVNGTVNLCIPDMKEHYVDTHAFNSLFVFPEQIEMLHKRLFSGNVTAKYRFTETELKHQKGNQ